MSRKTSLKSEIQVVVRATGTVLATFTNDAAGEDAAEMFAQRASRLDHKTFTIDVVRVYTEVRSFNSVSFYEGKEVVSI